MAFKAPERAPRTLILCFDGTADSFDEDTTNIVRLFSAFEKERPDRQLCYYQPGIGTYLGPTTVWSPTLQQVAKTLDQALAWYLDTHIMGGYRFLMQHYMKGDKICMFGFSRGAYTARCLAGMLNKIGLLTPSNEEQIPFAYKRYIDTSIGNEKNAKLFKDTFSMSVDIAFVGVWDTVASCGIFGRHLPFTASNEIIRVFRHALALDERRGKFKPNQWHRKTHSVKGAENDPNAATPVEPPFTEDGPRRRETANDYARWARDGFPKRTNAKKETVWSDDREAFDLKVEKDKCDVREVWFPGSHADVGGGSVGNDTPHCLANASLVWMVNQVLYANVGIIFKRDAFRPYPGLVPHYGGVPGFNPLKEKACGSKDRDSIVKLDTVEEDNEKTDSFDGDHVETTGVTYSAGSPIVTVTAPPPPTPKASDQAPSVTPSALDRKRLTLRWMQRRQQLDVVIPHRATSLSSPQDSPSPRTPPSSDTSSPISPVIASMENGRMFGVDQLLAPTFIEPQSRSSEATIFDNDSAGPLCWLSQSNPEEDAKSKMVDQLHEMKAWWILEYMPLWQHYQDREGYWHKGFHFNRGKVRRILDPGALFHSSAELRRGYLPEDNRGRIRRILHPRKWFHPPPYVPGAQVKDGDIQYVDF